MSNYVLVFAFDPNGRILLRRKSHPEWQKGKWNGVGGKIEAEDRVEAADCPKWLRSADFAAQREFKEETGLDLVCGKLIRRAVVDVPGIELHVYSVHLSVSEVASVQVGGEINLNSDRWFKPVQEPLPDEFNVWFDQEVLGYMEAGNLQFARDTVDETAQKPVASTIELIRLIESLVEGERK